MNWVEDCHGDTYGTLPQRRRHLRRRPLALLRQPARRLRPDRTSRGPALRHRVHQGGHRRPAPEYLGYTNWPGNPSPSCCSGSRCFVGHLHRPGPGGLDRRPATATTSWSAASSRRRRHPAAGPGPLRHGSDRPEQDQARARPSQFNPTLTSPARRRGPGELADQLGPGQREPDLQGHPQRRHRQPGLPDDRAAVGVEPARHGLPRHRSGPRHRRTSYRVFADDPLGNEVRSDTGHRSSASAPGHRRLRQAGC